jgi:predicted transcriptional regulator
MRVANYREQGNVVCFGLQRKYRSEIEIMALILEAVRHGGNGRYNLMKATGVNFSQLKKHLQNMVNLGFVEVGIKENKIVFKASSDGLAFLTQYNILREMLANAFLKTKPESISGKNAMRLPVDFALVQNSMYKSK